MDKTLQFVIPALMGVESTVAYCLLYTSDAADEYLFV